MKNYIEAFKNMNDSCKASAPGVYSGYSVKQYNGWKRFSRYVAVRDGTRLAVDYYRPTLDGELVETPLPVIWRLTPYGRILRWPDGSLKHMTAFSSVKKRPDDYCNGAQDGEPETLADLTLEEFTARGYIVASVDARGCYASFGCRPYINPREEETDAYDINEWLATQPWCNGRTGMFGSSYTGQTQTEAIRSCPPHLKACVVSMTDIDHYDGWCNGGIPTGLSFPLPPIDHAGLAVPVDEDVDGSLLKQAVSEHIQGETWLARDNRPRDEESWPVSVLPYRDSWSEELGYRYYEQTANAPKLADINKSGVAVYLVGGWYDIFRRDMIYLWHNITLPKKLIMGPWFHTTYKDEVNLLIEHLRFYDYWLKDIDNGVMDEPAVCHRIMGSGTCDKDWEMADTWPHLPVKMNTLLLQSATEAVCDKGLLSSADPEPVLRYEERVSDYTVVDDEEVLHIGDLDKKGFVYSGEVLAEDVRVHGFTEVTLQVSSSGTDADFIVYLVDTDEEGHRTAVTYAMQRASLREDARPPFDTLGQVWHPCREENVRKLRPNQMVRLDLSLKPTDYIFRKGHKIELIISNALDCFYYHRESPAPRVRIWHGERHSSYLRLPVVTK